MVSCFVARGQKLHLFIGCQIEYGHEYMITAPILTMKSIKVKNRWWCQITTLSMFVECLNHNRRSKISHQTLLLKFIITDATQNWRSNIVCTYAISKCRHLKTFTDSCDSFSFIRLQTAHTHTSAPSLHMYFGVRENCVNKLLERLL